MFCIASGRDIHVTQDAQQAFLGGLVPHQQQPLAPFTQPAQV